MTNRNLLVVCILDIQHFNLYFYCKYMIIGVVLIYFSSAAPPTMISTTIPEYHQKYVRCSDNLLFLKFDSVRLHDPNDYNCGANANIDMTLKYLCCEQDPSGHSCNIEAWWFIFLNDSCPDKEKVLEVQYTCVQASACSIQA